MPSRWGHVASGGSDRTVLKLLAGQVTPLSVLYPSKLGSKLGFDNISNRTNPDVGVSFTLSLPKIPQVFRLGLTRRCRNHSVTHICSNWFETVDSTVFFETPGDLTTGIEVRREDLQNLIQVQLKQTPSAPIISPASYRPILLEFPLSLLMTNES